MKLAGGHLTYCTNIHPGERWAEVRSNLVEHTLRVQSAMGADRFGVGLRLGAAAAASLQGGELSELAGFLAANDLHVFTINGFPYGRFHGTPVKEGVYQPDWREQERVRYTSALADILATLLPEGMEGSISTVPGGCAPHCRADAVVRRIAHNLARCAAKLVDVERRTGKTLSLALEPEPYCMMETIAQTVTFFTQHLLSARTLSLLGDLTGLDAKGAEEAMRRHLGVCLDACHAAVEFEDPGTAVRSLRAAGIAIAKVQLSAGLRIARVTAELAEAIEQFDEPTYLHQVVERDEHGHLIRYRDLPEAMAAARASNFRGEREWRIHFHVPIFLAELERFDNTQPWLAELLAIHRRDPLTQHLEVETYTWDVLPPSYRDEDVVTAIARELSWVKEKLA
jgi:sugar phosphate isomerase/epimerase